MKHQGSKRFLGIATIGEKGQAVIPAEARKLLKLNKGDKLLVFSMDNGSIVLTTSSHLERFATEMEDKLKTLKGIMKKNT
jgi:AbrB family looped-hinge helix DNA binding protein